MALRETPKPYQRHKWEEPLNTTKIASQEDKYLRKPYNGVATISVVVPNCARDVLIRDAYQKNIQSRNNEVQRMVDASLPSYIQPQVYPTDVDFKRDPQDRYVSFGI